MPEDYEIRGAHEAHVEHHAEQGDRLAQQIALFSAVAATLGAVVSLFGGHAQNDALYYKNEAVLMKARASDQWAYYQAEEIKQKILEASDSNSSQPRNPFLEMVEIDQPGHHASEIAKYKRRSAALRAQAENFDRKSEDANKESENALKPHIKLSVAMTFVQIAIALASITALTRKRWLFGVAAASALVGIVLALIAWS